MGIRLTEAVFIALFLEGVVYGVSLMLGSATVIVLLRVRSDSGGWKLRPLVVVLCFMLAVGTVHFVLSFIRAYRAFIAWSSLTSETRLEDITDPLLMAKNITIIAQTILGDGVNVWRFYVVYGRKLVLLTIPAIIMLAGLVSAGVSIAEFLRSSAGHTVFDLPARWIKAYDVCMIVTNLYCTFAISWKLYSSTRYQSMAAETWRVLAAVVETGLLYTAALITFLGTYLAASNAQYIVVDIVVPIVPCIFCMMILLIHSRMARHISTSANTRSTLRAGQIQLTTIMDDQWDEDSRGRETGKDGSVAAGSESA